MNNNRVDNSKHTVSYSILLIVASKHYLKIILQCKRSHAS